MRKATVISAGLHAAVMLWATVSFSSRSMDATPTELLPVDIVTDSQFTQLTKGAKDAEKKPDLKPLVEKVAPEEKTADEVKPKVTAKQEVQATKPKEATPTPPPEPKPAEKKRRRQPRSPFRSPRRKPIRSRRN